RGAAPARACLRVRPLLLDGRRGHDPVRAVALTLDGVPAGELAGRWHVPRCDLHPRLGSALDAIHALAAQGAPPGTTVIAEEQTAGRGRDGRTWHSPAGGVWLGMLLKPPRSALAAVAIRAGLALAHPADAPLGPRSPGRRRVEERAFRPSSARPPPRATGCAGASSAHRPWGGRTASAPTARCSSGRGRERWPCARGTSSSRERGARRRG